MQFTNLGSLNNLSQEIAYKNFKKAISTIARSADMLDSCHGMWVGVVDGHEQIENQCFRRIPGT